VEKTPWYQSAIMRQQIVQTIVALGALVGFNFGDLDVDATVASIFAGVAAVIAVWTMITRYRKPAPNLSETAARKEVELVRDGKIPPSPTGPNTQRGFFRLGHALSLAALAGAALIVAGLLSGCAGTRDAYRSADSLADTAYVANEHFAALVKQAADLAQTPTTSPEVKQALQKAAAGAKPLVMCDPATGLPSLRVLSERYEAARNAQTQADLQRAVDAAVRELANFINAVKAARRP
jgi:hypothetical protein